MRADNFDVKDMLIGETRREGITVERNDGVALVIASATIQVFDADTNIALTQAVSATIDEGDIYGDVVAGAEIGKRYVEFVYTVGTWVRKVRKNYAVI